MDLISTSNNTLMPLSALTTDLPLNSTFGAVLLGSYFSLILFGGIVHQTIQYCQAFPDDVLWLKSLVGFVVSAEAVHMALCMHTCYYFLVTGYSNPSTLTQISPVSVHLLTLSQGVIVVSSQGFFARRAYAFGQQSRGWAIFVAVLLLSQFVFVLGSQINSLVSKPWMFAVAALLAIAADGILTTILTLSLHRSRTGIKRTDSLMDTLILYTVTSGLLTSTFVLIAFVSYMVTLPHYMIFVSLSFVTTKLYANTFLAALNTRQSLREAAFNPSGVEIFGTTGEQTIQPCPEQGHEPRSHNTVSVALSEMHTPRKSKTRI